MRRLACTLLAGWLMVAAGATATAAEEAPSPVGRKIDGLTLSDYRGKAFSLAEVAEQKLVVVAFLGTKCPLAKLYAPRLAELHAAYAPRGVAFVGINSNQQDSLAEIAYQVRTGKVSFPMLKDPGNIVADRFGAQRTPEVFVLDRQRVIRYHGRIDDQYTYGRQRPEATRRYLAEALDDLLADQAVRTPQVESEGCHIGRILAPRGDSDVTYSRQISRILQNHCVECHRPGEVAPFSLTNYAETVGWAEMIAEVVHQRRMPPWHADPAYGHFSNDIRLSDEQINNIERWVAAGAPEGDRTDLPPPRQFVEGWRIGQPDQIVYMDEQPFQVPAEGEVKYRYFVVDPGFKEDKWIKAAECRPGNRAVVHHIIVAVAGQRLLAPAALDGVTSDWLAAMAPGSRPMILPDGLAKFVPAGSKLVFQMHYTPNGTAQEDRSSIGLVFADPATVKQAVATQKAATRSLAIPPGDENYPVEATHHFGRDTLLLALFPHMHLRGKAFRYTAVFPDGHEEILLDIPHYDFNWQNGYRFAEPKRLPAGSRIVCMAHYDNSAKNLANPDPTVTVRWGDQTWEEMMIGYFDMVLADQDLTKTAGKDAASRTSEIGGAGAAPLSLSAEAERLAATALESDAALEALAAELKKTLPQIDRVCLTVVADDKLTVRRAAQPMLLRAALGGTGISIRAAGSQLARYAQGTEAVINGDLAEAPSPELRFMSRGLGSSVHVPIRYQDLPATLNFWSGKEDAFPPPAVTLLKQLAPRVGPTGK